MNGRRVLVTGASGFIGRQCLPMLVQRGYEVHAVSQKSPLLATSGILWHRANLLDPMDVGELVSQVGAQDLLHFAWYTVPGDYRDSLENLRWVQATIELFRAFREHGGERATVAGTCFEYDGRYGYCSEDLTPLRPLTLYGVCKNSLQQVLVAFCRQNGLSLRWGRIFFLYGPHEATIRLIPSIVGGILAKRPVDCSHGRQIRDFMHVSDVAAAFVALIESGVEGPVNIGTGSPIILRDLIYRIARMLDGEELIRLGALDVPEDESPMLVADVSRLRDEIGWKPEIELEDGLLATINWWRAAL